MAEPDSESKPKLHIPFFFYDVIGRMMPGAYLMFGVILCCCPFFHWRQIVCFLEDSHALSMSGGLAAVLIGSGLLLFGFVSSFFGFLLAALSNVVVEKCFWRWSPLNYPGLVEFLGIESASSLDKRFKRQFGSEPTKNSLNQSSFLCAYYIWQTATTLGEMQGRYDSDLLASQSFVFVSVALIVAVFIEAIWVSFSAYFIVFLIALATICVASSLSFDYHRKKRVYGRFGLFLAITGPSRQE
jgi:hypothetical protein